MSVEIALKQNILVTDFHLLKSLLVVFGFGSQAFVCGFSRQNINSVHTFLIYFSNYHDIRLGEHFLFLTFFQTLFLKMMLNFLTADIKSLIKKINKIDF
jgi:hypothetical protein